MKKLITSPLIAALVLFAAAFFYIGPQGEFAINDDWNNKRQLESMIMGEYRINSLIDTSFIFQAYLGYVWALMFSPSFYHIRILTFISTAMILIGANNILNLLKVSNFTKFITLLAIAFNPIIFTSTFTFMTENYFLALFTWGLYFALYYFKNQKIRYLFVSGIFVGLSILTRQLGVFGFAGIFFALLVFSLISKFSIKKLLISVITFVVPVGVCFLVWLYYPQYETTETLTILTTGVNEFSKIKSRANILWYALPYIGLFALPLAAKLFSRLNFVLQLVLMFVSFFNFWVFFELNLFPIGNVFYIENLYIKNDFGISLSIFDNIPFKITLSYLITLSFITILTKLVLSLKDILSKRNYLLYSTFTVSVAFFCVVIFTADYYERYLIPFFTIFVIFLAGLDSLFDKQDVNTLSHTDSNLVSRLKLKMYKLNTKSSSFNSFSAISLLILMLISFVLTHEYITKTRIMWKQAYALQDLTGYKTQIYVNSTFDKYEKARKENNYSGLNYSNDRIQSSGNFKCYVRQYELTDETTTNSELTRYDELAWKAVSNYRDYEYQAKRPRILDSRKPTIPRIKKNMDKIVYNEQYYSFLYKPVGKDTFVGAWCDEDL